MSEGVVFCRGYIADPLTRPFRKCENWYSYSLFQVTAKKKTFTLFFSSSGIWILFVLWSVGITGRFWT